MTTASHHQYRLYTGRIKTHLSRRWISPAIITLLALCTQIVAADSLEIKLVYLEQEIERPPVLSNLVVWPEDEGEQGAVVGVADNNTTGKFLKHDYQIEKVRVPLDGDVVATAKSLLEGNKIVIANVSAQNLLLIADLPQAGNDLIFNVGSPDTRLRSTECRPNVLHTLPSRAMLTDALMQFFTQRKWKSIFLLEGNREVDGYFADSIRQSAQKYRIDIDHEKRWLEDADMRRNAAAEIPVFTQARKYDVVVVADEDDDFGQYVLYNTWLPRPVAGTAGLEAVGWHAVVEQWGAAQLQSRFVKTADRTMTSIDYAAWAAVRSVGEAVTRTGSVSPQALKDYIMSEPFSLAGFKGTKMNYRHWNGQLRQPIPLVHPQSLVAQAPIEGFLHHTTELDTLGLDQPESKCSGM